MPRDFKEERRWQLIQEEAEKLREKFDPTGEITALYRQNPLLNFLMDAKPKDIVAYREKVQKELEPYRLKEKG